VKGFAAPVLIVAALAGCGGRMVVVPAMSAAVDPKKDRRVVFVGEDEECENAVDEGIVRIVIADAATMK